LLILCIQARRLKKFTNQGCRLSECNKRDYDPMLIIMQAYFVFYDQTRIHSCVSSVRLRLFNTRDWARG